jgi:putative hydrolase of the HAD superfamily
LLNALIFDLDDTLYDEVDYCRSGFRAVAEHIAGSRPGLAGEAVFDVLWGEFLSGNRRNTFDTALSNLGVPVTQTLLEELVLFYRSHRPQISLPAESRGVLEKLSSGYGMALVTDGFMPAQRLKVESLGLDTHFRHIIYTEEMGREHWKPAPTGFLKALKLLDAEPFEVVCIGDNERKDFIAPNRMGAHTVQVLRPLRLHTSPGESPDAAAKTRINSLGELPPFLETFRSNSKGR